MKIEYLVTILLLTTLQTITPVPSRANLRAQTKSLSILVSEQQREIQQQEKNNRNKREACETKPPKQTACCETKPPTKKISEPQKGSREKKRQQKSIATLIAARKQNSDRIKELKNMSK